MNKQTFVVELQFSGDLTDEQHEIVRSNVLHSLIYTADTSGLVPDDAEEYTEQIKVRDLRSEKQASYNFKTFGATP